MRFVSMPVPEAGSLAIPGKDNVAGQVAHPLSYLNTRRIFELFYLVSTSLICLVIGFAVCCLIQRPMSADIHTPTITHSLAAFFAALWHALDSAAR